MLSKKSPAGSPGSLPGPASNESPVRPVWRLRFPVFLAACYLAVAVVFTWPLAKAPGSTIEIGWGDPLLVAYILNWGAFSLLHNPAGVFNASFLYPSPNALSYSDQLLSVSWPLAPLSLTGNPVLFHNLAVYLSYVLSALVFAAYLRQIGCGRMVAGLGGFLFGFNPWRFGQFSHPQLGFLWWIPLPLLLFEKWWKRPAAGRAILSGVCLAGALLASFYTGICFALYFAVYAAVRVAGNLRHFARIGVVRAARDFLLAAGACAVLVLPSARAYRAAQASLSGQLLPLTTIARRGADILDYVNPPPASLLWHRWSRNHHPYSDTPWEMHVYPGAMALLSPIAALLAIRRRGRREILESPLPAILVSGVLLFLVAAGTRVHFGGRDIGLPTPYRLLFDSVPGFRALRVPARAALFPAVSAIVLFSFSLDALRGTLARWWRTVVMVAIAVSLADAAPGRLRYAPSAQYARLAAAMRATDAETPSEGADLLLPLEACNFPGPLASAPRFRRLVNGSTGHRPPESGTVMAALGVSSFAEVQARVIAEIGVNRILIDSRLAAPQLEPSVIDSLQRSSCRTRLLGAWDGIDVLRVDCGRRVP